MKKLLAILLAVAMVMSFALVASADDAGYTAYLGYSDGDWWPGSDADDATATVDGPGTYTLSWDYTKTDPYSWGISLEGTQVCYIDIVGAYNALSGYTFTVDSVAVDGVSVAVDSSKTYVKDENGDLQVMIFNKSDDSEEAIDEIALIQESLVVTFTVSDPNASGEDESTESTTESTASTEESTTATEESKEDETTKATEKATESTKAPVAGLDYNAVLGFGDGDWYPQEWEKVTAKVTGSGTYTLTYEPESAAEGVEVLVIDIIGAAADLAECQLTDLTITVDGTKLDVDVSKVVTGDLEGKGNWRIEIYNAYGSGTKDNPPIDISKLNFSESMVITFTLEDPNHPRTGDSISVFVALLAVSACGIAVLGKKKFF